MPERTRSGIGKLPLNELAKKYGLDLQEILKILSDNNIKAVPEMTIKEIAQKNNMGAPDVYELIKEGFNKNKAQ